MDMKIGTTALIAAIRLRERKYICTYYGAVIIAPEEKDE